MDVSIIVPTLNEEGEIRACLKAINKQDTSLSYEVIVSDGYSEDRTVKIAEKYADKVVLARRGIWRGRNKGVRVSKGKTLVFIDADTVIPPNYIDVVHSVLKDKSIAALTCGFTFSKKSRKLSMAAKLLNQYFVFKYLSNHGVLSGFNLCTTKRIFRKVGGFPNSPVEDGKFGEKASEFGRIVFLPEPRVVTSARRLESHGLHGALSYYLQLMLTEDAPKFFKEINPLKYKEYFPVR
ncbi:MAG: glycosyltransferase [Candidatus Diapherotrites archaeon]|nr:glycosyltransferase [Candidatus Diapherotrites archaeon]